MGMSRSEIGYINDKVTWNYGWNPGGMGCSKGCECCWARKLAAARVKCPDCKAFRVHLHPERLDWPAKKKKPGVILAGFTHDWMDHKRPDQDIEDIMAAMVAAPQHQFVTLTQQAHHLAKFYQGMFSGMGHVWGDEGAAQRIKMLAMKMSQRICIKWPPPHIWNGVTIRTQAEADERLNEFTMNPGNLWLSLEPLWGAVDLTAVKTATWKHKGPNYPRLIGTDFSSLMNVLSPSKPKPPPLGGKVLVPARTWNMKGVIAGHDNRKGAPGTDTLGHIRSVVRQCKEAGVPVYVKQLWRFVCQKCGFAWDGMLPNCRICPRCGAPKSRRTLLRASHPDEYALYPPGLKHRDLPWDGAMQ